MMFWCSFQSFRDSLIQMFFRWCSFKTNSCAIHSGSNCMFIVMFRMKVLWHQQEIFCIWHIFANHSAEGPDPNGSEAEVKGFRGWESSNKVVLKVCPFVHVSHPFSGCSWECLSKGDSNSKAMHKKLYWILFLGDSCPKDMIQNTATNATSEEDDDTDFNWV